MDTQKAIIDTIDTFRKKVPNGRGWTKLWGDIVCRIFMDFINKEISNKYKVIGPNAYIKGIPVEFDVLIANKEAENDKYINAFEASQVKMVIEIKARGTFGGKKDLANNLDRIKSNFSRVKDSNKDISCVYLTFQEVSKTVKAKSINYLDETRHKLDPFTVYCLKDSRNNMPIEGQWNKFVLDLHQFII